MLAASTVKHCRVYYVALAADEFVNRMIPPYSISRAKPPGSHALQVYDTIDRGNNPHINPNAHITLNIQERALATRPFRLLARGCGVAPAVCCNGTVLTVSEDVSI